MLANAVLSAILLASGVDASRVKWMNAVAERNDEDILATGRQLLSCEEDDYWKCIYDCPACSLFDEKNGLCISDSKIYSCMLTYPADGYGDGGMYGAYEGGWYGDADFHVDYSHVIDYVGSGNGHPNDGGRPSGPGSTGGVTPPHPTPGTPPTDGKPPVAPTPDPTSGTPVVPTPGTPPPTDVIKPTPGTTPTDKPGTDTPTTDGNPPVDTGFGDVPEMAEGPEGAWAPGDAFYPGEGPAEGPSFFDDRGVPGATGSTPGGAGSISPWIWVLVIVAALIMLVVCCCLFNKCRNRAD